LSDTSVHTNPLFEEKNVSVPEENAASVAINPVLEEK
jgi:hypothetical protein